MSSILSYETAKRLKEAGFPQPDLSVGQLWYAEAVYKGGNLEHNPLCIAVETYGDSAIVLRRLTCEHHAPDYGGRNEFFCPTATDILKELGRDKIGGFAGKTPESLFYVGTVTSGNVVYWTHFCEANPAEAAALAWLSIHEKSETK
jgi:hypothetical protein